VFCHRPDPHTPVEETVWAMSDMIARGKALYWGTSEWSADEIRTAYEIAERHHLHKPVMEQPRVQPPASQAGRERIQAPL
jgi:aryl-alcohol dehydrogenase-like predicted oxidoreductase